MRSWCFLFLILISCNQEDFDGSQIPFEKRTTINNLNQEEMILGIYSDHYFPEYIPYIALKEIESGQHFIPVDTALLSSFLQDYMVVDLRTPFGGSVRHFLSFYGRSLGGIKVLVSGDVKQTFPNDSIPGLPLILSKIEIIPTCSVPFTKNEEQVNLQNTTWYWRGFVNESNQVYSFPSCENPNVSIMLTENLIKDDSGYQGYLYPNAMKFQLNGFLYSFFRRSELPVYEIKESKLEIYPVSPVRIFSPAQQNAGYSPFYSTRFTGEKADSLSRLIMPTHFSEPEVVEFILDGNQLILYNPRLKIRALFTSD